MELNHSIQLLSLINDFYKIVVLASQCFFVILKAPSTTSRGIDREELLLAPQRNTAESVVRVCKSTISINYNIPAASMKLNAYVMHCRIIEICQLMPMLMTQTHTCQLSQRKMLGCKLVLNIYTQTIS